MELLLSAEALTEWFYEHNVGYYPWEKDNNRRITTCTIQYLLDSRIPQRFIVEQVFPACAPDGIIKPSNLPDSVWNGSLVKRDTYYTHRELELVSPATDVQEMLASARMMGSAKKFWIEIRAQYTMKDLINYYYVKLFNCVQYNTDKQDASIFQYMLNKYSDVSPYVEPLDLILTAIDRNAEQEAYLSEPFDLQNTINQLVPRFIEKNTLGHELKACRIIWRSDSIEEETRDAADSDPSRDPKYSL